MPSDAPLRTALVLSGGGARGAYEAGILSWVAKELPRALGRPVVFDILTGTSVGAIHACYLAAHQHEEDMSDRLLAIWRSLSLDRIFAPASVGHFFRVPLQLVGLGSDRPILPATRRGIPERLPGLFDTGWLEEIILDGIGWNQLRRQLDEGHLHALAVAATEIATGRSVVFVDTGGRPLPTWARDPFIVARAARLAPPHALASAAIPLIFPAPRIDRTFFCDGGLRLNTPLSPALRLGADRVLVIGLRHPRSSAEEDRLARRREGMFASPTYLAGKALNALLLDRVEYDVDRMRLFNSILESGVARYGEEFLERVNEPIVAQRGVPYRRVRECLLRPSRDLGEIAADCLRHQKRSRNLRDWLSRNVVRYAGHGAFGEADLLSYLYFDHCYAEHLIELGYEDAKAAREELLAFFA